MNVNKHFQTAVFRLVLIHNIFNKKSFISIGVSFKKQLLLNLNIHFVHIKDTHNKVNTIHVLYCRGVTVHLIFVSPSITAHLPAHCWQQTSIRFLSMRSASESPAPACRVIRVPLTKALLCQRACMCVSTIMVSELTV